MADLKIKAGAGSTNKLLIQSQDQSNNDYAIQVGDAGATTLTNATLTNATLTTATMTAGTLASGVILNHDAKENAWSRFATANTDKSSAGVVDFGGSGFIGSNITESSGRMTCTVAGLYLIMLNMSQYSRGNRDLNFTLRKNASDVPGFHLYEDSASDGTYYNGSASILILDVAANDILDIHGTGYYSGHATTSTTCFSAVRLGASS